MMHEARHPLLFTLLDELVIRERMPRQHAPRQHAPRQRAKPEPQPDGHPE